jgi:hypothetical protein
MYHAAGSCIFTGMVRNIGLDLTAEMFAPCLLGRSACHSISANQVFKKMSLSSGLLIHRVGGSSPSRRTMSDLVLYRSQITFLCPICPVAGSVLARVFFGWSCAAVKLGRIGLDQSDRLV